jgi:hypothetical protein
MPAATSAAMEEVAPLLLNGTSQHAVPQLDARVSGTGCAATAAQYCDPAGSTGHPAALYPCASPCSSTQQHPLPASAHGAVALNTLFSFLPLTSDAHPQINLPTAASPPFLFASPNATAPCNIPAPSILLADPYTILSSLLPDQPLACTMPSGAAPLPYTALPESCMLAPIATGPPHHTNTSLQMCSANLPIDREAAFGSPQAQHVPEPANCMNEGNTRMWPARGVSLPASGPAFLQSQATAGLPPMPPSLPNGVCDPHLPSNCAATSAPCHASELPQLLHHLPDHLQSWLQVWPYTLLTVQQFLSRSQSDTRSEAKLHPGQNLDT